ncbi:MAG: glycosyltransferase family 4 protein [Bacteroidetes bacterium]|nr:glycosyltransferase family 4 protein [Bacteroidota bacterium]MBS1627764.1 glycosyltransferase family 4 protein [Bacteroidota bacterium]MBS1649827.1 glycosyltransferase family 4 protein [Bacteroidota bacterium]
MKQQEQKYRVAINATILDDKPSGLGMVTMNIINRLPDLLPDVHFTIYTSYAKDLRDDIDIKLTSKLLQYSKFKKLSGLYRLYWNQVVLLFISRRYNLIYSPTPHGSLFIRKQIITIHDLISIRTDKLYAVYNLQAHYYNFLLPSLAKKCVKIISVSNFTKGEIIRYLKCDATKIVTIYNGYNKELFNNFKKTGIESKQAPPFILAVGATYPHKNIEYLIRVFNKLKNKKLIKHYLLIAGGKNAYLENLKVYITELGISEWVIIKPYVTNQEMSSLYKQAACLVYPSLCEGFGLPVIEAMACDCPVISSNYSSLGEIAGNACLFIDPLDENSLEDALILIINNESIRNDVIQKGRLQAQKYSWEKTASDVAFEINSFLNKLT